MSRYAEYQGQDTPPSEEGDAAWVGVNDRFRADRIPQGYANESVNNRFDAGSAETRLGLVVASFLDTPETKLLGLGVFQQELGQEWIIAIGEDGRAYRMAENCVPVLFNEDPREIWTEEVNMIQAANQLLAFSKDHPFVRYDPNETAFADENFYLQDRVVDPDLEQFPNSEFAIYYKGRIWGPKTDSIIVASDPYEFHNYDPVTNEYNVNSGEQDKLTALVAFSQNAIVVFKEQSIYLISNIVTNPVTGEISDSIGIDTVSTEIGCKARKTAVMVGPDIFFLSEEGISVVTQQIQGLIQTNQEPLSSPIQKTIDRINWDYASNACAAVSGAYFYCAVPLDDSTGNNALLVYDTRDQTWEGVYEFASGMFVDDMVRATFAGRKELYGYDSVNGKVFLLNYLEEDRVDDTIYDIASKLVTRGYLLSDNDVKGGKRVKVVLDGWNYDIGARIISDGVNEFEELEDSMTPVRTSYMKETWGKADYSVDNVNDDHGVRGREDYTVTTADGGFYLKSGIQFKLKQTIEFGHTLRENARSFQVEITNARGQISLVSVSLEAEVKGRDLREKV